MEIIKGEGAITKLYEAMSGFAPRFCSIAVDFCDEKCADEVRRELSRWYNLVSVGDEIKEEDAIRAVVSVGKTKKAVALANKYSLPLVTVVISPDCVSAFLPFYGDQKALPKIVLCDYLLLENDENALARGYGRIVSLLGSLFDRKVNEVIGKGEFSAREASKVTAVVSKLLSEKKPTAQFVFSLYCDLFEQKMDCSLFLAGGGVGFERLLSVEEKERDVSLLSALTVMRSYVLFLRYAPVNSLKVPSHNARMDWLFRIAKIPPVVSQKNLSPYPKKREVDEVLYCVMQSRTELLKRAILTEKALTFGFYALKRLYKDKGFSYNSYPRSETLGKALALAPELVSDGGLLAVMKWLGVTERYLT